MCLKEIFKPGIFKMKLLYRKENNVLEISDTPKG